MATMILRDTHRALEEKMKELDKQKKRQLLKFVRQLVMETLKKMVNITPPEKSRVLLFAKPKLYKHIHHFR